MAIKRNTIIRKVDPHPKELYAYLDLPEAHPLKEAWFYTEDKAKLAYSKRVSAIREEMCEGFSNKETWAVAYHLDNTPWMQGLYLSHREALKHYTGERDLVLVFAEKLRGLVEGWHERFYTGSVRPCRYADMRNLFQDVGSLWRVDWKELAEHLLKD